MWNILEVSFICYCASILIQIIFSRSFNSLGGFLIWQKDMLFGVLIFNTISHYCYLSSWLVALIPNQAVWPKNSWQDSGLSGIVHVELVIHRPFLFPFLGFSNPTLFCIDSLVKIWLYLNPYLLSYKCLKKNL